MTDRAETAECRYAEAESNYESDMAIIARLTEYAESYKRARDFMAGRFKYQDDLLDRVKHWKQTAEVAEKDCSENLVDRQNEENKLKKEVRKLTRVNEQAGRQKVEDQKRIERLEKNNKELNAKVNNLTQEVQKLSTDRGNLQNELKTTQDELKDSEEQLTGYKEDTEERNEEMAKVKKVKSAQETELRDLRWKYAVAETALKSFISIPGDHTGKNEDRSFQP